MTRSRDTGICLVQKVQRKQRLPGFRDFFVYKICEDYLFDQDMEIQCVEGDGNCLPTSVIKTLDF